MKNAANSLIAWVRSTSFLSTNIIVGGVWLTLHTLFGFDEGYVLLMIALAVEIIGIVLAYIATQASLRVRIWH